MSSTRNCPKSKGRNVPTRVRRRQSDAKWRASVQSCYESLKLIIPESRRSNKRKLSKALILQETENHISYLEDVLTTLLEEKEKQIDHGLIVPTKTLPRTFQEIKDEFILKIQPPLQHLPKPKKLKNAKRGVCNSPVKDSVTPTEPDKIICTLFQGDQYYYLSSKTLCLQKATPPGTDQTHHWYSSAIHQSYTTNSLESPPSKTSARRKDLYAMNQSPCSSIPQPPSASPKSDTVVSGMSFLMRLTPHLSDPQYKNTEVFLPQMTPSKNDSDSENVATSSPWHSAALSSIQHHPAFLTPSKVTRKLPFDVGSPSPMSMKSPKLRTPDSPCFGSPVTTIPKEPLFLSQLGDSFMEVPSTPVLKSEPVTDHERDDTSSLLCTESIDNMELGDEMDWLTEQSLMSKRGEQHKDLQHTPCPENKAVTSCCPSEKELQDRPKKAAVKRCNLFSETSESHVTPAKCSRLGDKPKCCKQLENLYDKGHEALTQVPVNVISVAKDANQCSSFEGYFYFYRQMSGALEMHLSEEEMKSPSFADAISKMWKDMNEDQKTTLATIAALENSINTSSSSSELSEDLSDISVTPISHTDLIHEFHVVPCESSQTNEQGNVKNIKMKISHAEKSTVKETLPGC